MPSVQPWLLSREPLVDAWLRIGDALVAGLGDPTSAIRWPLGLAVAAWLAYRLWRRRRPEAARTGIAALLIAWVAQSHLLDLQLGLGCALYAAAAGVYLWGRRSPPGGGQPLPESLPVWAEAAAAGFLLALFGLAGLYRLETVPVMYYDEIAFLKAARMTAGLLEPGPLGPILGTHAYSLERIQAQALPHALQVLGVAFLSPGILSIRLPSLLAGVTTLAILHVSLRRRLGPRTALVALGLAGASPLLLAYSRTGLYHAVSTLHGALCLALALALWDRWSRPWAVLLGLLLGSSLYLYQVSWFAPAFLGAAWLVLTPELRQRPRVASIALAVAVPMLLATLPAAWALREGMGDVGSQTFGRGALRAELESPLVFLVAPRPLAEGSLSELRESVAELGQAGMQTSLHVTGEGLPVLSVSGARETIGPLVDRLEGDSWRSLGSTPPDWELPFSMLAQLFYSAGWESNGRIVAGPVLNPLLAPLLVLGAVEALRRRREPWMRVLLVWLAGAAVAPALLGGVLPRRTILLFPFAAVLMVLPLREIARGFRGPAALVGAALGILAATAAGHAVYFSRWDVHPARFDAMGTVRPRSPARMPLLEVARVVNGLPEDEVVLMPPLVRRMDALLALAGGSGVEREPRRLVVVEDSRDQVLRAACAQEPPFRWLLTDTPEHRGLREAVEGAFQVEAHRSGDLLVLRATARRDGGCAGIRDRRLREIPARPTP